MKNLVISAFAICLAAAAPTALWAQDQHSDKHDQSQPKSSEHGSPMGGQPSQHATPSWTPTGGMQGATHRYQTTRGHGGVSSNATRTQATSHYRHATTTTYVTNRPVERSHVSVNITTYRQNITAERRFHYGEYRAPPGYEYRRWAYGERLPAAYFVRDYWIPNYLNFGLPYAPDGYVWVRYGSDALLIDENTGEIIQVRYDVYY